MNEINACRHTRSSTLHGYRDILARFGLGIYRQLSRSDDEDSDQITKQNQPSDNKAAKLLGSLGSSAKTLLAKAGSAPSNSNASGCATTNVNNGQQQQHLACALSSNSPAEISPANPIWSNSSTVPAETHSNLKEASNDAERQRESRHPRFSVDGESISSMCSWGSWLANEHHAPAGSSPCNDSGQHLVIPRFSHNGGNRRHNSEGGTTVLRQSQQATTSILEQSSFVQSMVCEEAVTPMLIKQLSSTSRPAQDSHIICMSDAMDSLNGEYDADDCHVGHSPPAAIITRPPSLLAGYKHLPSNETCGSDMVPTPGAVFEPAVLEMQMQVTLDSGPSTWATPFAIFAHKSEHGLQHSHLSPPPFPGKINDKHSNSGRPAIVPRLDLSALALLPDEDGYDTDDVAKPGLPSCDKFDEMFYDSEEELEQELVNWAKTPTWLPSYEGRKFVYGPVTHQEILEYDQLVASLPPTQARACQRLWSQMAEARYACELMASRGTRIVKDVTHEWSQMSSHLIQRIEAEQASTADMQAYCTQQNFLIQQLTHQLRFAHMFKREPGHLPHSASQPTMQQVAPSTESMCRQPRRAERGGMSHEQLPRMQSPRISAPVLLGIPEFSVPPYLAAKNDATGLVTTASEPYAQGGLYMHNRLLKLKDSLSTPGTSNPHLQVSAHDMQSGFSSATKSEPRLEQAMIHELAAENQRLNNQLQHQLQAKASVENENHLLRLQISRLLGMA